MSGHAPHPYSDRRPNLADVGGDVDANVPRWRPGRRRVRVVPSFREVLREHRATARERMWIEDDPVGATVHLRRSVEQLECVCAVLRRQCEEAGSAIADLRSDVAEMHDAMDAMRAELRELRAV